MPVCYANRFTSLLLAAAYGERPLAWRVLAFVDDFIHYFKAAPPSAVPGGQEGHNGDDGDGFLAGISKSRRKSLS